MRYLGLKETKTSKKITQVYSKNIKLSYKTQNKKISFKKVCSIGDRELIMSTYPMSQNLQVAPRLLSGNGGT